MLPETHRYPPASDSSVTGNAGPAVTCRPLRPSRRSRNGPPPVAPDDIAYPTVARGFTITLSTCAGSGALVRARQPAPADTVADAVADTVADTVDAEGRSAAPAPSAARASAAPPVITRTRLRTASLLSTGAPPPRWHYTL